MASDDYEEPKLKRLTVRELRDRAVKSLGPGRAAALKTKQELIDGLVAEAAKAAAKPKPKKVVVPTTVARSTKAKPLAKPQAAKSEPDLALKAAVQEPLPPVHELPVARDFFVDPKKPALPTAYGDDRLLCFRREPLAVVVSWDLSGATFADGQGLSLEVVTVAGRLQSAVEIAAPTGLATFEGLPEGQELVVQVVRRGRVMTRARPFVLGALTAEVSDGPRKMTVDPNAPLEGAESEPWPSAPRGEGRSRSRRGGGVQSGQWSGPSSSRVHRH